MKNIFLLTVLILNLTACGESKQPLTRSYLMNHPDELAALHKQCKEQKTPNCQLVNQTFDDFSDLYQASIQSPQQFGLGVLEAELAASLAKANLEKAKVGDNADVIAQAEQIYQEKKQAVDERMAVLRMMAPN